jgi:hypothetical protein
MSTGGGGSGTAYSFTRPEQPHSISIASNAAVFFIGSVPDFTGELGDCRLCVAGSLVGSDNLRVHRIILPVPCIAVVACIGELKALQYKYSAEPDADELP